MLSSLDVLHAYRVWICYMLIEFGCNLMPIEFEYFMIIELGAYFRSYRVCLPYAYRVWIMVLIELRIVFAYRV